MIIDYSCLELHFSHVSTLSWKDLSMREEHTDTSFNLAEQTVMDEAFKEAHVLSMTLN